jgi:hypothetical protein
MLPGYEQDFKRRLFDCQGNRVRKAPGALLHPRSLPQRNQRYQKSGCESASNSGSAVIEAMDSPALKDRLHDLGVAATSPLLQWFRCRWRCITPNAVEAVVKPADLRHGSTHHRSARPTHSLAAWRSHAANRSPRAHTASSLRPEH